MPKVRSKLKAPTLVDLIQIWLSGTDFSSQWFIDRYRVGGSWPDAIAYLSSQWHDLPIQKDHVVINLPEGEATKMGTVASDDIIKLHASDPKFFRKLASILGLIQSQDIRLLRVRDSFYAEDLKKVKRVISQ